LLDPYRPDPFEPNSNSNEPQPTAHCNLCYKFQAAFAAAVNLADFEFYYTVPTEQSHHYNLSPHSSPLILTPSTWTSSPINIPSNPVAANILMPAHGDHTAPKFDLTHPRELHCYFSDLDFIFRCAGITDNTEKKQYAVWYVNVNTSKLWEALPKYSNNTKTYSNFTKVIYALYPGSEKKHKWSVADMDKLVGEQQWLGVLSLGDLGEYYRQFLSITSFLISKHWLSTVEQSRAFVHGFQNKSWMCILQCFQLKLCNHFPDDPYRLEDIHEATQYVLHGMTSTIGSTSLPTITAAAEAMTNTSTNSEATKKEDLATMFKSFIKVLQQKTPESDTPRQLQLRGTNTGECVFCGLLHYICKCSTVQEYINTGKCKRNDEGKVVLPNRLFVQCDIPGHWLRDRIDEWHRQNLGQVAAQMMYNLLSNGTPQTFSTYTNQSLADPLKTMQLSTDDHIESLKRKLFQLKSQWTNSSVEIDINKEAQLKKTRMILEVVIPKIQKPNAQLKLSPPKQMTSQPEQVMDEPLTNATKPLIHPYANANDGAYTAPQQRNFAGLLKLAPPKKPEPVYLTTALIYNGKVAANVYDCAMSTQVTLTQCKLLLLSPKVRYQVREVTSAKQTPPKDPIKEIHTLADDTNLMTDINNFDSLPHGRLMYPNSEEDEPTATLVNTPVACTLMYNNMATAR
jgi:hypothetical protein